MSGKGQYIDMSLLDCIVTVNSYQAINYFLSGHIPQRMGNAHSNMVPYQVFPCKEGDVIIAVGNDGQYAAFCQVIGCEYLATAPTFATGPQRTAIARPDSDDRRGDAREDDGRVGPLLEAKNVPCGPIYNMKQVFEDPQVRHREMQLSLPHGAGVERRASRTRSACPQTPISYQRLRPCWESTTKPILQGRLGLSPDASPTQAKGVV